MKHLLGLALCCLLLTGCGSRTEAPIPTQAPSAPPPSEPVMLYDKDSPMEEATHGAVRTYPLPMGDCYGIRAMGSDLLIFSGEENTTLTRVAGEAVHVTASLMLNFHLGPEDPSVQPHKDGLSYFDPGTRETVVLDASLEEIRRIAAPQDSVGVPILSGDGSTLYYTTAKALRGWNWEAGIPRLIKELTGYSQTLTGLYMDGTLLTISSENRTMLISAEDGRTLWEGAEGLTFRSAGDWYYTDLPAGLHREMVFGTVSGAPQVLTPKDFADPVFLEHLNGAVTMEAGTLSYYDLDTGMRSSVLNLPGSPMVEDTAAGMLYLMCYDEHYGGDVLYRWDVTALPSGDQERYTTPYGDTDLSACTAYAAEIGNRYGITVLIGQEAASVSPLDYDLTPEPMAAPTWRQLQFLDACLSNFPKSLLEETIAPFGSLTVSLVREITGSPASGSLAAANGLQFRTEDGANLALAVGPQSDGALYHELFHVMETKLLTESTAFDQWENLNPKDFRYAMSYDVPQENSEHLHSENRAFIDLYSMSFPKEDRARIMEYAISPGNAEIFEAEILQAKLTALCKGIRDAFDLKDSPEHFLWEQYLKNPMAYSG